jgi:hypothetical protein
MLPIKRDQWLDVRVYQKLWYQIFPFYPIREIDCDRCREIVFGTNSHALTKTFDYHDHMHQPCWRAKPNCWHQPSCWRAKPRYWHQPCWRAKPHRWHQPRCWRAKPGYLHQPCWTAKPPLSAPTLLEGQNPLPAPTLLEGRTRLPSPILSSTANGTNPTPLLEGHTHLLAPTLLLEGQT